VGQSDYIVRKVLDNREAGIPLKAQAVLFRASSHSAGLEVELTRKNIPFGSRSRQGCHRRPALGAEYA
jgi:DNA helicase-2/ATP-dependent DNA helicase PcrA